MKGGDMPVRKVGNKWQYGATGKKYTSKKKAILQGRAIKANQARIRKNGKSL